MIMRMLREAKEGNLEGMEEELDRKEKVMRERLEREGRRRN